MSDRFVDGTTPICADFLNEVDDLLLALCNASTTEEIRTCLQVLTESELAQQYLRLDGTNRMLDQLSLEGSDPVEDWHAAPKKWIEDLFNTLESTIGFARREETQVAHGFTIGQPIYWDGIQWQLAIATGLATAGTHVVAVVTDADNFQAAQFGWVDSLPVAYLTPGAIHYVSPTTPGTLTLVEPAFSNPIFIGISDTLGWVISQRAIASSGLDFASLQDVANGTSGKSLDPDVANQSYLLKSAAGDGGSLQEVDSNVRFNTNVAFGVEGAGVSVSVPDGTLAGKVGAKVTLTETLLDGETENTIQLRRSAVEGEVPSSLASGEGLVNTTDEILYFGSGTGVFPISGGGGGSLIEVSEVAHGYTLSDIGKPLYFDGSTWEPAKADLQASVGVALLADVDSVDSFVVQQSGLLEDIDPSVFGGAPLVAGTFYYVSAATAGQITGAQPVGPGEISNPILLSTSATQGLVLPFRASSEGTASGRREQAWTTVAGQTVFAFACDTNALDVYLNGAKLTPTVDYTADADGFTLTTPVALDTDVVYAVTWPTFDVADTYTTSEADARFLADNVVYDSTLGAAGNFDLPTIFSANPQYSAFTIRLFGAAPANGSSVGLFLLPYGQSDTIPTGGLYTRMFYVGQSGAVAGYASDASNAITVFYTSTTVDTATFRLFTLEVRPHRFGVSGNVIAYFNGVPVAEDVSGGSTTADMPAKGFQLRFDNTNPNFAAGTRLVVTGEV